MPVDGEWYDMSVVTACNNLFSLLLLSYVPIARSTGAVS